MTASSPWPVGRRGALGLAALAVVAWLVLPSAPNYDTATHLVWARELLAGRAPDVTAAAAPTLHPLWLVIAVPAVATGAGASLLQLLGLLSLAVVVACAWRLAADLAGAVAGWVAAVAVGSSFALLLLAFKAYVDLPFLALVLVAVVAERAWRPAGGASGVGSEPVAGDGPRSGPSSRQHGGHLPFAVPVLLLVAGLLRPEAWALGLLLVGLRVLRGAQVREVVAPALIVLVAPVLWALADYALSGSPVHSLTGTQQLAEELGRKTGLANAPVQLLLLLGDLARPPIAAAGLLGVGVVLWRLGWRRVMVPLAPLAAGAAGFILVGALGLPLLQRYLLVPAALLCVFAGVAAAAILAVALDRPLPGALGGARPQPPAGAAGLSTNPASGAGSVDGSGGGAEAPSGSPALRAAALAALVLGVLGAGGYLALKAGSFRIVAQGVLREARWQREAADLLDAPAVRDARACGPVTLPTYRFIPELELISGLPPTAIVSRARQLGGAGPQPRGVAIVIAGDRRAKTRLGWAAGVPRTTNAAPPGFRVVAQRGPFVATARC